jgi:hypothetical protein
MLYLCLPYVKTIMLLVLRCILQECGILLGECLTCEELSGGLLTWGLLTGEERRRIERGNLQECGEDCGGCLTMKN